jgi:hypothetical protein
MPYDYTDAPPPRDFDLIPHGTVATIVMHIRPGNVGEDGMLKRSKDGGCEMLDAEFVVADGEFKRRKFWGNMILAGTTDGHAKAAEISRGMLKTVIESAHGINPDDLSPEARAARTVSLAHFDGLTFIGKIGIEKGGLKPGGNGETYNDKNFLAAVITPDKKGWHPVEQAPPFDGGGAAGSAAPPSAAPPVKKPGWASQ